MTATGPLWVGLKAPDLRPSTGATGRYFSCCPAAGGGDRAGTGARRTPHEVANGPSGGQFFRLMPANRLRAGLRRLLPQGLIALARHGLERIEIDDLYDATGITDCVSRLYLTGHCGDRRAANVEHLGKKFLREFYRIAFRSVAGLQQPPA